MAYYFIKKSGGVSVEFKGKNSPRMRIGFIKNRVFKRRHPKHWMDKTGNTNLSYVQTLAAYKALVKGLIGPQ